MRSRGGINFIVVVRKHGPSDAHGAVVSDDVPAGIRSSRIRRPSTEWGADLADPRAATHRGFSCPEHRRCEC